jgi:hypothetical protein
VLPLHVGRYQNGTKTDQLYEVAADLEQPTTLAMGACGEVGPGSASQGFHFKSKISLGRALCPLVHPSEALNDHLAAIGGLHVLQRAPSRTFGSWRAANASGAEAGFGSCRWGGSFPHKRVFFSAARPVQVTVNYHHAHRQGVDWVFVDHPCFHRPGDLPADSPTGLPDHAAGWF